jgi:hypothetical protein
MGSAMLNVVTVGKKNLEGTAFGPKIDVQINTCGYHPAKRDNDSHTGAIKCADPSRQLKTGTEFWQSTAANNYEKWDNIADARPAKPE